MSIQTKIQWCDATFNPWIGCTKVSPGCAHCYAEMATPTRVLRAKGRETWGAGSPRHRTSDGTWAAPVAWNRDAAEALRGEEPVTRPRVFCASLSDWLDDAVPIEWLTDLLALIHATPHLDWLLLTKRPENWRARLTAARPAYVDDMHLHNFVSQWLAGLVPANVWIGTTVEDQKRADERREHLRAIPAAKRFVSYEPALEQVDWAGWEFLDWLIMGGESGPGARPLQAEWFWETLYWCRGNGVAPFVKQLGAHVFTTNANAMDWPDATAFHATGPDASAACAARVVLIDKKGGDLAEFPTELQVREFPAA